MWCFSKCIFGLLSPGLVYLCVRGVYWAVLIDIPSWQCGWAESQLPAASVEQLSVSPRELIPTHVDKTDTVRIPASPSVYIDLWSRYIMNSGYDPQYLLVTHAHQPQQQELYWSHTISKSGVPQRETICITLRGVLHVHVNDSPAALAAAH
jgi:hypothetical protein